MGRYKVLLVSVPVAVVVMAGKFGFHSLELEPFSPGTLPMFTAGVTGIIFLLGVVLAGVLSDYKEAEKIPGEMAASAFAIWLEMDLAARGAAGARAEALQRQLLAFIGTFRQRMLLAHETAAAFKALDVCVDGLAALERDMPPQFLARVRGEVAALRRLVTRVQVIRDTDFAASVSILVKFIVAVFLTSSLLLRFDDVYVGLFFCGLFSFLLVSILRVIDDMDDPFEYREGVPPVDEIDFFPLFELESEMERKLGGVETPPYKS